MTYFRVANNNEEIPDQMLYSHYALMGHTSDQHEREFNSAFHSPYCVWKISSLAQIGIGVNHGGLGIVALSFWNEGSWGVVRGFSMKYYCILKCIGIRDENTFQSDHFSK